MKTKIIILGVVLALVPAVANAKTYKPHKPQKWHYTMTYHRPTHIKCPYAGCRSKLQP